MADILNQVTEKLKLSADKLDQTVKSYPLGKKIADTTKVRPAYLVAAGAVFVSVCILFFSGQNAFANLVGFVYPLYASYKAIKSENKKDDTQWLTYWVVYSGFTVIESFTDLLLNWVPMYYLMKTGFLVWCFLDKTQGATIIYHMASPFLDKLIPTIDGVAAKAGQAVQGASATFNRTSSAHNT